MPTSIFILEFISGYCANVCTTMSCSLTKSLNLFTTVTRRKYLERNHNKNAGISTNSKIGISKKKTTFNDMESPRVKFINSLSASGDTGQKHIINPPLRTTM